MVKDFLKKIIHKSQEDGLMTKAAAISFYALVSLLPMLVIILFFLNFLVHDPIKASLLLEKTVSLGGPAAGNIVSKLIVTSNATQGNLTSFISIALLLLTSIAIFGEINRSLNKIWDVKPRVKKGNFLMKYVKPNILAFFAVIFSAIILVIMAVIPVVISFITENVVVINFLAYGISFILLTLAFMILYRVVPNKRVSYKKAVKGGIITIILIVIGQIVLGVYFSISSISTLYGASSYLIVMVLWIYYSSIAFLLGAEITHFLFKEK